ncbi:MAG: hypothetical protein LBV69_10065 [Bacteroidales bacterium]|jgi:hypothetical protein|nr:hypothetical protein [Bacteroidales bacterium]
MEKETKKDKLQKLFDEFELKNSEKKQIFGGANSNDCTTGNTGEDTRCVRDNQIVTDDCDDDDCDLVIMPIDSLPSKPIALR